MLTTIGLGDHAPALGLVQAFDIFAFGLVYMFGYVIVATFLCKCCELSQSYFRDTVGLEDVLKISREDFEYAHESENDAQEEDCCELSQSYFKDTVGLEDVHKKSREDFEYDQKEG